MGTMTSSPPARATIAGLERISDKAELIAGKIIPLMPGGYMPGRVAFRIASALDDHVEMTGQ